MNTIFPIYNGLIDQYILLTFAIKLGRKIKTISTKAIHTSSKKIDTPIQQSVDVALSLKSYLRVSPAQLE